MIAYFFAQVGVAQGSIFSTLSNFLSKSDSGLGSSNQVIVPSANSQNMALLQAPLSVDVATTTSVATDVQPSLSGGATILPEAGPLGASAILKDSFSAVDQISVYTVHEGDTLDQIAKMFNVSVNTLLWANDLSKKDKIKVGDTLVILPMDGIHHTIKRGETIEMIAKKYQGDREEILSYNDLPVDGSLTVGDVILIPNGKEAPLPTTAKKPSATTKARNTQGPIYDGYYLRPIKGGVRTQGLHGNNAIDLAAPIGTPIYASAAGRVIISRGSGWNSGYGSYIVIQHNNGTQTLYSHNSVNYVSVGQSVVQGQVIGEIGSTGRSTGPHVHFEVRGARNPF